MSDARRLQGIGVSPGCVVGPAYLTGWGFPETPDRPIAEADVASEIERLREARQRVAQHLADLGQRTETRAGSEEAKIFDAQIMMLGDNEFFGSVEQLIRQNQLSAERAFEFNTLELLTIWGQSESALLRQKRADLFGIGVRVLKQLLGQSVEETLDRYDGRPVIVVTRELSPALTVEFDHERVAGFASVEGTKTSHAAILAHSLGIPCVMGFVDGLDAVAPNTELILDGSRGTLVLDPTAQEIADALSREARRQEQETERARVEGEPAVTTDGVSITLRANVDLPEELQEAVSHGADGVGLVRTEFLVIGRAELPTEDEQANYYTRIANSFPGQPVVVRSYDLGGDKFPAAFRRPREANPFLGWRAIRVCLDEPEMFKTQLRALLRARTAGDVQLMLPLITGVDEVLTVRKMLAEVTEDLDREGIEHGANLPVGVMIETPAAVMIAEELARHSDFLSVGTNDLTQYVLAVDRGSAHLASRFTPYHPAVVRTLERIAAVAQQAGRPLSVCGEMASEPMAALLLLGLGYTTLSVAPPRMSMVRWVVRQLDASSAASVAREAVEASTTAEVTAMLSVALRRVIDLDLVYAGQLPDSTVPTSLKS